MGHRLQIDPYAFLGTAGALLLLPLDWYLSAVAAAAFHELCHILSVRVAGLKILGLSIGMFGASMEVPEMSRGEELLCAAVGPMGSLCLLFLGRWFPKLAICGLIQGAFNLLPIYPLDGGRVLKCLVSEKAYCCIQRVIGAVAALTVIFLVKYSVLPLFILAIVALRLLVRKIPCKEGK